MAIWDRLTTLVAGGALSRSASTALDAAFETTRQQARAERAVRVLDPGTAAELRARETQPDLPGIDLQGVNLADDARRGAVGKNRFDLLTELARTWPGISELITMRRRNQAYGDPHGITDSEMTEALRRQGYTRDFIHSIHELVAEKLTLGEVAAAIHRGLIPDQGLLKGETPEPPFTVEHYPVYQIDGKQTAKTHGYDEDELGVLVGLQGFPMGPIEAANAYFRGDITYGDYLQAFNLSNNRNEWAKATLAYARQIPTARDYIENALRGYRSFADAAKGAARHGMSEEDALLIFQNSGRPLNLHQITQALAWGGKYQPAKDDDPDPWVQAVLLGAVRPEYYDLQEHLKYLLPSAFFFKVLQQQKVITEAEAVTWYKRMGWPPELAEKVAHAWATDGAGAADPWTKKAQTQFWTTTHRSFVAGETDDAEARDNLKVLGLDQQARDDVIELWTFERDTTRKQLTPAQIKKAWKEAVKNPVTAKPWTRAEAVDALLKLGYSLVDAETFLDL